MLPDEKIVRKGFGRIEAPDARDRQYPMAAVLRPTALPKQRYYMLPESMPLDQGETGTCCAHAGIGFLLSAPLMCKTPPSPFILYREIVALDEFTENDHEVTAPDDALQFGTTVRATVKALQARGHIKSYVWSRSAEESAAWLLSGKGPLIAGTDFYWDMCTPDKKGYVSLTGGVAGGHAYLVIGFSRIHMAFRCINQWGKEWGQQGRFWIRMTDMDKLIRARGGELCAPVEQIVRPQAAA